MAQLNWSFAFLMLLHRVASAPKYRKSYIASKLSHTDNFQTNVFDFSALSLPRCAAGDLDCLPGVINQYLESSAQGLWSVVPSV